ncbi:MAG: hypoxanthine phosphoribosyltransferase [Deltaproteobacteria bacterium]|nr:hypoxanthine phosphoribosyltransferase [Deltaproteobacteria bacterium]
MSFLPPNYHPLFSRGEIAQRILTLGAQITQSYKGKPLTVLVVLKGSYVFAADLVRAIELPINVEFIGLRSYGDRMTTSGVVEITMDVKHPLMGEHVLIVEDIVDTGLTLDYLIKNLRTRNPASLALAALLHKPSRTKVEVPIDYLGFEVPDKFVIGYGLDFAGKYRNLPEIGYLDPPPDMA